MSETYTLAKGHWDDKWALALEFKLADFWIGAFWQRKERHFDLWLCLLPCLPIHLSVKLKDKRYLTEKAINASRCMECLCYHGAHKLTCSLITVEHLLRLVKAGEAREVRNREAWNHQRKSVAFWQSKFSVVKQENNRLRRRLNVNALQPTVRERAIEALKRLKGFDLNLEPEEVKRLYELNIRSLVEDFAAVEESEGITK